MLRTRLLLTAMPMLVVLALLAAPAAGASTLTVTNAQDKGAGSLRDTITNAKSGDTIVFSPALNGQTITLTSGELVINKSLDVEGPGADELTISGNDTSRVFTLTEGLTV